MHISVKMMLFILLMLVLTGGCKKHPSNMPDIPNGFSMQINNVKWTPTIVKAGFANSPGCTFCPADSVLGIEAYDNNNGYMNLSIDYWTSGTGTFVYPPPNNSKNVLEFFYNPCDTCIYGGESYRSSGRSGEITITKFSSSNVQGTFKSSLASMYGDTISISGEFNLPLNQ